MGILNALFGITIENRKVAFEAKEYALRLDLSELDKQVIDLLRVERHVFVAERQFLLIGLLRTILWYSDRHYKIKPGQEGEISTVAMNFENYLTDHFKTLPGISIEDGYAALRRAD